MAALLGYRQMENLLCLLYHPDHRLPLVYLPHQSHHQSHLQSPRKSDKNQSVSHNHCEDHKLFLVMFQTRLKKTDVFL